MILDVRTLLFAQVLMSFALAGAVLVTRRASTPEARSLDAWAAGESLYGVGYAALFFVGVASPFVSGPLANSILLGGYLAFVQAVARFVDRPMGRARIAVAAGAIALTFLTLPAGAEGFAARGAAYVVALGAMAIAVSRLLRHAGPGLRGAAIVRAAFVAQWLLVTLRAAGGLIATDVHLLSPRAWQSAPFAGHMIVNVACTLGFLMMLQERARNRSDQLARIDPLTGLLNRRGLLERLQQELHEAARQRHVVSVVSIDLDHFKGINDQWGHAAGDQTLAALARLLRRTARSRDIVGRLGGEEFVIVLPQQDEAAARRVAERMQWALHATPIGPDGLTVTASFGIASHQPAKPDGAARDTADPAGLLHASDLRLYEAKRTRDAIA